ncbi:hypothetical protein FRB95_010790 [Tulasnella sp. JGI-2019a]|nr:hypothetical protein FRB95_010790 [Tulasnella sp. JGI-2019a]
MSLTWKERVRQLSSLLDVPSGEGRDADDIDALGQALEQFIESQKPRGRSGHAAEVENLRFGNKDLVVIGTLTKGQFGTLNVVRCQLDGGTYVRKTILRSAAVRFRQQCSVEHERQLLLRARQTRSVWAPHLLCAFQTVTDLNLVMQYAEGGCLEDVLNCTAQGHLTERDMLWWIPQTVAAIAWCHSEGFIHRDIKPQNFVLTASAHLKLIDFGSAAPLQPPDAMGVQVTAKMHCLMPCGTVDYIAPEILQICEDLLVAQDLDEDIEMDGEDRGYGREVDWWSLGAMMYEMACSQAPFFADDIGQTYEKIKSHQHHALEFDPALDLSPDLINLIRMFLCSYPSRLGRRKDDDVQNHRWFHSVRWPTIHIQPAPADLVIPDFSYAAVKPKPFVDFDLGDDKSDLGHHFSAFFQSSIGMSMMTSVAPTPASKQPQAQRAPSFAGFTWGPPVDAFSRTILQAPSAMNGGSIQISASPFHPSISALKRPGLGRQHRMSDPNVAASTFFTPVRPSMAHYPTTIPRTGTGRRVRPVSDREALRQMLVHVGMSVRKKVLESGKKPRNLTGNSVSFAPLPALNAIKKKPSLLLVDTSAAETASRDGRHSPSILSPSMTSDSSAPPSPSPRPGSAMSRRSIDSADGPLW